MRMEVFIMKKIVLCMALLLLAGSVTACGWFGTQFDGSRLGNENQLVMDYKVLNQTDTQSLKLEAGDVVGFAIVSDGGQVDLSLQKDGEEAVYEGTDVPTSSFQVAIEDSGTYLLTVTGRHAKGSVRVTKESDI